MAVTGTGTIDDPFVVTTYSELVNTASTFSVYIKVGNDINITDEYPDGDMPTLQVNSPIDGDGHVISNWYRTVGAEIIVITDANHVDNLTIKNIYVTYDGNIFNLSANNHWKFNNCKISGYVLGRLYDGSNPYNHFKNCSLNIKTGITGNHYLMQSNCLNCYIHVHFTKSGGNGLWGNWAKVENSYIETTADDSVKNAVTLGGFGSVTNCVIDSYLTTSQSLESYSSSGVDLSIINSTHAPNYTVSGKLALVDDEHWLDTSYLASIGFNAG